MSGGRSDDVVVMLGARANVTTCVFSSFLCFVCAPKVFDYSYSFCSACHCHAWAVCVCKANVRFLVQILRYVNDGIVYIMLLLLLLLIRAATLNCIWRSPLVSFVIDHEFWFPKCCCWSEEMEKNTHFCSGPFRIWRCLAWQRIWRYDLPTRFDPMHRKKDKLLANNAKISFDCRRKTMNEWRNRFNTKWVVSIYFEFTW